MFAIENYFGLPAHGFGLIDDGTTDTACMGTPATLLGGTGDELRYAPPYGVEEYFRPHGPNTDARWSATMPTGRRFLCPPALKNGRRLSQVNLKGESFGEKYGMR